MTSIPVGQRVDRAVRRLARWADARTPGVGRAAARALDLPVRAVWHVWRNRSYLSLYKLLNMGLVNAELLLHRERLWGRPYIAKVEPTNLCNSTCRLCPTGRGLAGRAKGRMTLEQFRRIIDEIKAHTTVVDLSNWGDPLLVPDIHDMIRYAHDARIWTYLSSNLHALRPDRGDAEKIVRSGLDMLNCSLHAATQKTYETYQPGKRLDEALEKVKAILEAKRRLESPSPAVQLFFVVTKFNEHEIDEFRALAERLGCEAVVAHASLNLRLTAPENRPALRGQWLPQNEAWIAPWYRGSDAGPASRRGWGKPYPCDWPWWGTVINWDGAVSVCCGDFDPHREMGNIFKEPLAAIWNNDAYRAVRRSFAARTAEPGGEPCRSCSGVML